MMARQVFLMVKEPQAGRVKTRLGADIGMTDAAWWYRHQVARMIRRLECPKWSFRLAIAPDTAFASPVWPLRIPRVAQGRGDLGQRMSGLFGSALPGQAVIVGSDIPDLAASHIAHAFRLLGRNDAVFGPSSDGGYWLVGLRRTLPLPPKMFRNVRWSTSHALADSIASLPGYRVAMADTLTDVDSGEDLPA